MDAVKCHPALPNGDHDTEISTSPSDVDGIAFNAMNSAANLTTELKSKPVSINLNQSKALEIINKEVSELEKRKAEAGTFRKYPGISWPVTFGIKPEESNFFCFEFVRPVPKIVPSIADSVYGIRLVQERGMELTMAGAVPKPLGIDMHDA